MNLKITSWACNFCHNCIEEDQEVLLVIHSNDSFRWAHQRKTAHFPDQVCPFCTTHEEAFAFHPLCLELFQSFFREYFRPEPEATRQLFELGKALDPILPVDGPSGVKHMLQVSRRSFNQKSMNEAIEKFRIKTPRAHEHTCTCCKCLLRRLRTLPNEILSDSIAPIAAGSPFQNALSIIGDMPAVLSELQKYPPRSYHVSGRAAVFETRFEFGGTSYITGLYNEEVPGSSLIKPCDEMYDYICVRINRIGITAIEFVCSDGAIPTRSKGDWVYAVAALNEPFYVKSKGLFLERILESAATNSKIMWDFSGLPFLMQPDSLLQDLRIPQPDNDMFLHYVPLNKATGISMSNISGDLHTITAHTDLSLYTRLNSSAMWTYFPLSSADDIENIWAVYPNEFLRIAGLVIQTKHKVVWLVPYFSPVAQEKLNFVHMASGPIRAFYQSDFGIVYGNHLFGTIPARTEDDELEPTRPPKIRYYRTRCPFTDFSQRDWMYSEASLADVEQAELCMEGSWCLGMLLHYKEYKATVGQFRYDKEIVKYTDRPRYISVLQDRRYIRISFFQSPPPVDDKCKLQEMTGTIVWWYSRLGCEVSLFKN
ncbi:hypothetical protein BU24DRAFT_454374 [Aaosphaeria arxii CBS 175.79]|uniref:Uncharacterized protein n=1 Tax=Aaosphaeria arxii CBS 175.79 TaxID=1450172 RepID=A0A6A5XCU0_9PLEO|nr:uncharacterized protein BU24DRAFT_454374 [Aaosphaeria arxii CBS 175.79]KAF2010812.1 hypothetical protein BU24DRAFT_454374 [Aaosphaeria arxii CBS 175.79]